MTCLNNFKVDVTLKMKIKGEQPHQLNKIPKKPKKVKVLVNNVNIYLVIL